VTKSRKKPFACKQEPIVITPIYTIVTRQQVDAALYDTDCLTPKQERAIVKKINDAMDRSILNALAGGYYVQPTFGTTFDHRPRRRLEKP
jgi:hypothetical protein